MINKNEEEGIREGVQVVPRKKKKNPKPTAFFSYLLGAGVLK